MRALITGASSGIGKELAVQLSKLNYDLILVARRLDRLKELKDSLNNSNVIIMQFDLNKDKQLKEFMNDIKNHDIDLFINCAGFGKVGYSSNIPVKEEIEMIHLNIDALHQLTRLALSHMKKGKIVNISSLAAHLPTPNLACYAATKAYVSSYSQALNFELKQQKIPVKILTVEPGPVKTEFALVAGAKQKMKGMPVDKCVKIIIKGIHKGKSLIVPGFKMRTLKFILKFIPISLQLSIAHKIQTKK